MSLTHPADILCLNKQERESGEGHDHTKEDFIEIWV